MSRAMKTSDSACYECQNCPASLMKTFQLHFLRATRISLRLASIVDRGGWLVSVGFSALSIWHIRKVWRHLSVSKGCCDHLRASFQCT